MLKLDVYTTLIAATLVLLLGRLLVPKISFLRTYTIPEPVVGGLIVALLLLILRATSDLRVVFDTSLQTHLMLAFFATMGLSADLGNLKRSGKTVAVFLAVATGLLVIQNGLGVGLATLLGLDPHVGLLAGSITLSGGHGTGAAWGAVFSDQYNMQSATEIAMACATFGLVLGGLIGGPVARYLVKTYQLEVPGQGHHSTAALESLKNVTSSNPITAYSLIETLTLIFLSLKGGELLTRALSGGSFELPTFVCVLFVGVLIRNLLSVSQWHQVRDQENDLLGNLSLSLFLAMAMMSLNLWDLHSLALPIFIILAIQTLVLALYAVFITYRVMGKNYDAAMLAAAHCGFGLGALSTAIANMQAISQRFGPSHLAFLVVPMVGAFFIDIFNAIVIKLFLLIPLLAVPFQ